MRIKQNHKGFSLVEILLGVTILAIITVPITHAFVTSARTSTKAQNIRSQTVAAQNVLEAYEATNIGEIIADIKGNNTLDYFENIAGNAALYIGESTAPVTSATEDVGDGAEYRIELENVSNGKYDAAITVKADGDYQDVNLKEIVNAKPMSAVSPISEPLNSPDVQVAKDITRQVQMDLTMMAAAEEDESVIQALQAEIDSLSYLDFIDTMERKITITLTKTILDTGKIKISSKALFEYDTEYKGKSYDGDRTVPILCDEYNQGGNYGLFFFYYPNLNTADGSDIIDIFNEANLELNVYLIRQNYENIPKKFPAYHSEKNKPVIILHENNPIWQKPGDHIYALLYTNIKYVGATYLYNFFSSWNSPPLPLPSTLGGQTSQNRIYKVTVDLYESGKSYAEDAKLFSMDASSVE